MVLAASLGGDTDTIGAMAGALAGAYWGVDALPAHWLGRLENEPHGKDYVLQLCRHAAVTKTRLTNLRLAVKKSFVAENGLLAQLAEQRTLNP